ncbi:hypothetical protein Drose_24650 [Dactylosporangium roseum]|uniref:Uncharacterized protein n=1 Tax=Dactylosporangium roseum TaxID=47989 RepID=A0ABY5Z0L1_9ACTN|nr:hypothetical protein [Dactylosporangium roseum]UWZ34407.1 hypothetical protein Drose_24650 [Dactylosporangium roseum]
MFTIGTRLHSQVDGGEVIVVRADGVTEPLRCAGLPMTGEAADGGAVPEDAPTLLLGKRYELVDEVLRIEVLVTRPGAGPLSYAGRDLTLRPTKPLPSSD